MLSFNQQTITIITLSANPFKTLLLRNNRFNHLLSVKPSSYLQSDNSSTADKMEEVNNLGHVVEHVDRIVTEGLRQNADMQTIAKDVTVAMTQLCPKWNWTVLCGDNFDVSSEGRQSRDVMLLKQYYDVLKVVVFRGSPLDKYTGGPAVLAVVRNKLPNPYTDADNIRKSIEESQGETGKMVNNVRVYLQNQYPRENWIVIAGDDFALSQDYEQVPSIKFCATVGHLSMIVVKPFTSSD